ncbi:hypothetical protein NQ314_010033 [Rhamnusium bicolor]|uniref:Gustatory receptor n=1 Tax=Rhamnusium bicolor TaxID=1586634 RepID=A0AAV8XVV8_9CUCU|nr:hypothetical protein NQ314_010033 [Rhamnusium bicolor]
MTVNPSIVHKDFLFLTIMIQNNQEIHLFRNRIKFRNKRNESLITYENNDFKMIKLLLSCGKYLFVTPFNLEGSKVRRHKLKNFVVLLLIICTVYTSYIMQHYVCEEIWSGIILLLKMGTAISHLLFVGVCFSTANIIKEEHWQKLYYKLNKVEILLNKLNFDVTIKMVPFYIEIFMLILIYIGKHTFYFFIHGRESTPFYFGYFTTNLYSMFIIFLIFKLTLMLQRRYNFLSRRLVDTVHKKITTNESISQIKDITKILKLLYTAAKDISDIFGWNIFFYMCVIIFVTLFIIIDISKGSIETRYLKIIIGSMITVTNIVSICILLRTFFLNVYEC